MKRNNQYGFRTNRDRDAFGEVLKRSDLSYAKGQFWRLEFVGDPVEADCRNCQCGHANIRLVWNYGDYSGFGSDEYCLSCFKRSCREWLDNLFARFDEQYHEYRAQK
jgi:hypothetical protein